MKGLQRDQLIYGEHMIERQRGSLVIVEGFSDAWRVWEAGFNAAATMGTSVSDAQIDKIVDLTPGSHCVIMFDGDDAGQKASEKLYLKLKRRIFVDVVHLADDVDPGDMSCEDVRRCLKEVVRYDYDTEERKNEERSGQDIQKIV